MAPWGKNGVRVRVTREAAFRDLPQGLLDNPTTPEGATLEITSSTVTLTNSEISVKLEGELGQLSFERTSDNALLLKERKKTTAEYSKSRGSITGVVCRSPSS